jgi:hypothetical protein
MIQYRQPTPTDSTNANPNENKDPQKNENAIAILKEVRERQKDRRETDPSRTLNIIREARSGGMYGH